jgi:hypothetical protein
MSCSILVPALAALALVLGSQAARPGEPAGSASGLAATPDKKILGRGLPHVKNLDLFKDIGSNPATVGPDIAVLGTLLSKDLVRGDSEEQLKKHHEATMDKATGSSRTTRCASVTWAVSTMATADAASAPDARGCRESEDDDARREAR